LAPTGRPAGRAGVREEVQPDTLKAAPSEQTTPAVTEQVAEAPTAEPTVQAPFTQATEAQDIAQAANNVLAQMVQQVAPAEKPNLPKEKTKKKPTSAWDAAMAEGKRQSDLFAKKIKEDKYRVTIEGSTKQFTGDVAALAKQLRAALDRMGLQKVGVNLERALTNSAGKPVEGVYANKLIEVALNANNPAYTLNHEALHAMKEMGFFSPNDWNILSRHAPTWIKKYDIANRYQGLNQDEQIEEAIAEAFGYTAKAW
jgi:hypothetical protein